MRDLLFVYCQSHGLARFASPFFVRVNEGATLIS